MVGNVGKAVNKRWAALTSVTVSHTLPPCQTLLVRCNDGVVVPFSTTPTTTG